MKTLDWGKLLQERRRRALRRPLAARAASLRAQVTRIIGSVRQRGDAAVFEATRRYDGVSLKALKATPLEFRRARRQVCAADLAAMEEAARRIEAFHRLQVPRSCSIEVSRGVVCGRRFVAIPAVGLYAPGGSAPLPSTVLMLGVPARLAGCPVRILATPPRRDGSISPHILVAADLVGVKDVYKMGGAQAVAAMAWGTRSVPKVDKIFGPGSPWVTEAKAQAAADPGGAACDFQAGPSEVLVIADARANPAFVASDLLAQAEHGADSQVVLVSDSPALIRAVAAEAKTQLRGLPRKAIAAAALSKSLLIYVSGLKQALEVSNRYAPEHLILHVASPRRWLRRVINAGSVFIGPWSPEAMGDYASGPNHVLPTYGWARAYGGLTVEAFMKSMTFQEATAAGLRRLGPVVERLALIESLQAHKESVSVRLRRIGKRP